MKRTDRELRRCGLLLKIMQRLSQAQRAWGDFAEIRELNLLLE
jgi:hypothetical protein